MKSTDQHHLCFVCGKQLELAVDDQTDFHPTEVCVNGNRLTVIGGYGSEVFDPFDSSYLAGAICNECLRERINRLYLMRRAYTPDLVEDNDYE